MLVFVLPLLILSTSAKENNQITNISTSIKEINESRSRVSPPSMIKRFFNPYHPEDAESVIEPRDPNVLPDGKSHGNLFHPEDDWDEDSGHDYGFSGMDTDGELTEIETENKTSIIGTQLVNGKLV